MIKAFLILTILLAVASSFEWQDIEVIVPGNPAKSKFNSWQIRTAVFEGAGSWVGDATKPETIATNYHFNISSNPNPSLIVADADLKEKFNYKSTFTKNLDVQLYWSQYLADTGFTTQVAKDVKGMLFSENVTTIKRQRTNFYSCAWYQDATKPAIPALDYSYVLKDTCQVFSLGEWTDNMNGQNITINYGGFGKVHVYIDYVAQQQQEVLPLYIDTVKVNKISFWVNQEASKKYKLVAGLRNFNIDLKGWCSAVGCTDTNYKWGGFYLMNNADTPSTTNGFSSTKLQSFLTYAYSGTFKEVDDFKVILYTEQKYTTGSKCNYWSNLAYDDITIQEAIMSDLVYYCGETRVFTGGQFQVELEITCTNGAILKLAMTALAMIAGLFMMV